MHSVQLLAVKQGSKQRHNLSAIPHSGGLLYSSLRTVRSALWRQVSTGMHPTHTYLLNVVDRIWPHTILQYSSNWSHLTNSVIKISLKIRRHLGMASRKSIETSNSNSTLGYTLFLWSSTTEDKFNYIVLCVCVSVVVMVIIGNCNWS